MELYFFPLSWLNLIFLIGKCWSSLRLHLSNCTSLFFFIYVIKSWSDLVETCYWCQKKLSFRVQYAYTIVRLNLSFGVNSHRLQLVSNNLKQYLINIISYLMIECIFVIVCRIYVKFEWESETIKLLNIFWGNACISISRDTLSTDTYFDLLKLSLVSISSVIGSQRVLQYMNVIFHLACQQYIKFCQNLVNLAYFE